MNKTCLFFDGCYWHGHSCELTKHSTKPLEYWKRSQEDYAIRDYLRRRGYNIVEMKECQWQDRRLHGATGLFLNEHFLLPDHEDMSLRGFLDEVMNGAFFGMVRCSIRVRDVDREKWSDLPPIFKNVEVGRQDIGDHMRQFCE